LFSFMVIKFMVVTPKHIRFWMQKKPLWKHKDQYSQ
jgi:hypothetical protein